MKKILIPTDFSDCAKRALEAATDLALRLHYEVDLLHVIGIPAYWKDLDDSYIEVFPKIKEEIENAENQLKLDVLSLEKKGIKARYFIKYSSDTREILEHASNQNIALIVMGSHGASGTKEFLIGSNAQKIVRMSQVPVLIVKDIALDLKCRDLVFVSDFEPEAMESFIKLVHLAEILNERIHLLYLNTPAFFEDTWSVKERMETFSAAGGSHVVSSDIYNALEFEDGLIRYSNEHPAGIIAMATHGRKGFNRLLFGSLTEKVVNHVSKPVLSMPIMNALEKETVTNSLGMATIF